MLRKPFEYPLLLMVSLLLLWSGTSSAYYPGYQERGGVLGGAARGAIIGGIVSGGNPRAERNGAVIGAIVGGARREQFNRDNGVYVVQPYRAPYLNPYRRY